MARLGSSVDSNAFPLPKFPWPANYPTKARHLFRHSRAAALKWVRFSSDMAEPAKPSRPAGLPIAGSVAVGKIATWRRRRMRMRPKRRNAPCGSKALDRGLWFHDRDHC